MDGSMDISGDEQEAIYLKMVKNGLVRESFLALGSQSSTCLADLRKFLLQTLQRNGIDKDKIIGLASDGASNMVGNRRGLSTLLQQEVNNEMVNVNCYAHCLKLAFRDVFKKNHLIDKLMTLLIGLYYFYNRSHKNKRGLETSMEVFGGTMQTKVNATR